jgi:formylglycine-generating enzyme required for sulfatase activity
MVLLSWERAQEFCTRLSGLAVEKKAGRTYRLPTEAEWEYACRAGTTTTYFFGDDATKLAEYAWTAENANRQVHPVGQKKPNPWGLYDLYGNAGEWCQDAYDADFYGKSPPRDPFNKPVAVDDVYVHRGGDIFHQAANTRSALRFSMKGRKSFMFAGGMRVVCEVAGK